MRSSNVSGRSKVSWSNVIGCWEVWSINPGSSSLEKKSKEKEIEEKKIIARAKEMLSKDSSKISDYKKFVVFQNLYYIISCKFYLLNSNWFSLSI